MVGKKFSAYIKDPEGQNNYQIDRVNIKALERLNIPGPQIETGEYEKVSPKDASDLAAKITQQRKIPRTSRNRQTMENPLGILSPVRIVTMLATELRNYFDMDFNAVAKHVLGDFTKTVGEGDETQEVPVFEILTARMMEKEAEIDAARDAGEKVLSLNEQLAFLKVYFHIGNRNTPLYKSAEYRSPSMPLSENNVEQTLCEVVDHIGENISSNPTEEMRKIPFKMVFFHDPGIYAPNSERKTVLTAPLSFAMYHRMDVGEFLDYAEHGRLPTELRLGFDAQYFWDGDWSTTDQVNKAFQYTRPWEVFETLCAAHIEKIFGSQEAYQIPPEDMPFGIMQMHRNPDIMHTIMESSAGISGREVFYAPKIEMRVNHSQTVFAYEDNLGVMVKFAEDTRFNSTSFDIVPMGNGFMLFRNH